MEVYWIVWIWVNSCWCHGMNSYWSHGVNSCWSHKVNSSWSHEWIVADGCHRVNSSRCQSITDEQYWWKDVERAFGVSQSRFAIVRGRSRMWFTEIIGEIVLAYVIMHNMIVEDERVSYICHFDFTDDANFSISMPQVSWNHLPEYENYLRSHLRIRNKTHNSKGIWLKRFEADLKTLIKVMFYFYLYIIFLIQ